MGLFDLFKQASGERAGRVMVLMMQAAERNFEAMTPTMRLQIVKDFCEKRENLISRLPNMTTEGRLKTGYDFQVAGNKLKEASPIEGYPLLLVGMWLESANRPGIHAEALHDHLDNLATMNGGSFI